MLHEKVKNDSGCSDSVKLTASQLLLLIACQCLNLSGLVGQFTWWFLILAGIILTQRGIALFRFYQSSFTHSFWVNISDIISRLKVSKLVSFKKNPAVQPFQYQPSKKFLFLLTTSGLILLLFTAKSMGILTAMIHLLAFSYLLKVFELKKKSSFIQLVFLGFFVLATNIIFSQTIYFTTYIFIVLTFNIALLASFYSPNKGTLLQIKSAGKLILQSLPLAVLLFVFFPKIPPFWSMPKIQSAQTGLSDSLTVGDVSNLALSNDLAFRVTFEGDSPPVSAMYWRAIVLDEFDGTTWRRGDVTKFSHQEVLTRRFTAKKAESKNQVTNFNYSIIQQASYQQWLFALDVPFANNQLNIVNGNEIDHLTDNTLYRQLPVDNTIEYSVASYIPSNTSVRHSSVLNSIYIADYYTAQGYSPLFNDTVNPKLQAFAQRLSSKVKLTTSDPTLFTESIIKHVSDHFYKQPFRYTLQPPLLTGNTLDQFFFETLAGFCGHYASTFTFIMRSLGIPARVVSGYLGGEYNPNGKYFTVYQRDAHAWAEVWIQNGTDKHIGYWKRVDPTASVHPQRIEKGFAGELRSQQQSLSQNYFSLGNYPQIQWLNSIRLQLGAIDYQWTKWVLNYSLKSQDSFLKKLFGKSAVTKAGLFLVTCFSIFMLIAYFFQRPKVKADKLSLHREVYIDALKLMNEQGIVSSLDVTPSQFIERVNKDDSQSVRTKTIFNTISQHYIKLTYVEHAYSKEKVRKSIINMKRQLTELRRSISANKRIG